jgi:hypothetical protein
MQNPNRSMKTTTEMPEKVNRSAIRITSRSKTTMSRNAATSLVGEIVPTAENPHSDGEIAEELSRKSTAIVANLEISEIAMPAKMN